MRMSWLVHLFLLLGILGLANAKPEYTKASEDRVKAALKSIREDFYTGTIRELATLECVDFSYEGDSYKYVLTNSMENGANFLRITSGPNATIYVKALLDSEQVYNRNTLNVRINCLNRDTKEIASFVSKISIIDINDNPPEFDKQSEEVYSLEIPEVLEGTLPIRIDYEAIYVTDHDKSIRNSRVEAKCRSMLVNSVRILCDGYFEVTSVSVPNNPDFRYLFIITALRKKYDARSYVLTIYAENVPQNAVAGVDQTQVSGDESVTIVIQDLQNEIPEFVLNRLAFEIYENQMLGTPIGLPIQAADQDTGAPNVIVLSLIPNLDDPYGFGFLEIGETLPPRGNSTLYYASIFLVEPIDREAIPGSSEYIYVDVVAQEYVPPNKPSRPTQMATARVSVKVLDINDEKPKFDQDVYNKTLPEYTGTVAEEELEDEQQIFANIKVTDDDRSPFNRFFVEIVSGNELGIFSLNTQYGQRSLAFILSAKKKGLDFEKNSVNTFNITLKATDQDSPNLSSTAMVIISLSDSNDNRPIFPNASYSFSLPENSPLNYSIGKVSATDADANDPITYSISGDSSFYISADGTIYLNASVDYETRISYQISVIARDSEGQEAQATVSIIVSNINDVGPKFTTDGHFAVVYEEDTMLSPNITISAVYGEEIETIYYGIRSVDPPELFSYFEMNNITGRLRLLKPIDYKQTKKGFVILEFNATAGDLESTTSGSVSVIDINNFPPEFQPNNTDVFTTILSELEKPGHQVYNMTVIDRDGPDTEFGKVAFLILQGSFDTFTIGPESGVVAIAKDGVLDYELFPQYTLVIRARDNGIPVKTSTASLIIQIENKNNKPPVFSDSVVRATVKQDEPVGTNITKVTATDPDNDSRIEYSLSFIGSLFTIGSSPVPFLINGSEFFSIDKQSGILTVAGSLDRNKFFDRAYFTIVAEDVNVGTDQPRQIATMEIRVTVLASDERFIYFQTDQGPIIDPTVILDFKEVEIGERNVQLFLLQAFDPNVSRSINIYIEKEFDVDIDDYFGIENGYVVLKKTVDFEALDEKEINTVIYAIADDQSRTGTLTLIVNVEDINDNPPKFGKQNYEFSLRESRPYLSRVGSVSAIDVDSGIFGLVNYILSGPGSQDFQIFEEVSGVNNIGVIYVGNTSALDYEKNKVYNFRVTAFDNPNSLIGQSLRTTVPIQILLIDDNDNPPIFREKVIEMNVVGTVNITDGKINVGEVVADDLDEGRNGQVEYYIQSSTNFGTSFFRIRTVPRNVGQPGEFYIGQIYPIKPLDSLADDSRFEMIVIARDNVGRAPQLTGTATVIVTVSKGVKDPKPKWEPGLPSSVYIPEDSPIGSSVAQLIARPANDTSGIVYSYFIDGSNDYQTFALDTNTGDIQVNGTLNYNSQKVYNLLVRASDINNSSLTNQFLLVVHILDVNNHLPTFTSCPGKRYPIPVITSVPEETQPPVKVHQAKACDLDPVAYHEMRYTWFFDSTYCPEANSRVFTLDEDDGTIRTRVKLNREAIPEYLLCVQVSEKPQLGSRKRRDMISDLRARTNHDTVQYVKVIVEDKNDNGPTFFEKFVQTVILEYPPQTGVSVAEAFDPDQAPNNDIRYTIDSIDFSYRGKKNPQPTAFTVSGRDGTIDVGINDFSHFNGGFFDIVVRASDSLNGDLYDNQTQQVYVAKKENLVRVVFNKEADLGVENDANNMVKELNDLNRLFYQIKKISYHIIDNDKDPVYSKTDVCLVVLRRDNVLSATDAADELNRQAEIDIIRKYGARDPGTCEPAKSVYPDGWESYWWVLVAFAIFIFILVLILIILTIILHNQYKNYMDTRKTYLVPGN